MIKFLNLYKQHKPLESKIIASFRKSLKKGDFILGNDVHLFENEFAAYCNTKYAVGVSSGTAALFLALWALDIKQGDEVIVPDFTYIASALAVSYTKATPVLVDIDEKTFNMNPQLVNKAITKRTKAIMPVHLYGQPADMKALCEIARLNKCAIIEDAAQAHGAAIQLPGGLKKTGSFGDMGCFSFYPTKNLGALGDGGMITTHNEELYKKLLMLRDYGRISKYEHAFVGFNSRLDTIQAGFLRIKLKKLNQYNARRKKVAEMYTHYLSSVPGIKLPQCAQDMLHVYHVYGIRLANRQRVIDALNQKKIQTIVHYPIPVHLQKAYSHLGYKEGDFPVSEAVSKEILSLPMSPDLTEKEIKLIAATIKKVTKS